VLGALAFHAEDAHHLSSALPPEEQRSLVTAILQREVGVMALSAVVVVVLLAWGLVAYALLVSAVKKKRMLDPVEPGRAALSPV